MTGGLCSRGSRDVQEVTQVTRREPLAVVRAASVRIAAAQTLAHHDEPAFATQSLDLLAAELDSRNEWAACRAARALELLGERARPKFDAMTDALRRRSSGFFGKKGADPTNYGLEFSLRTAVERLRNNPLPK